MRRLLLPFVVCATSRDVVWGVNTSLPLLCSSPPTRCLHGVAFTEEEMMDEEHLARLLVQNTPVFPASPHSKRGEGKEMTSSYVESATNKPTVSTEEPKEEGEEEEYKVAEALAAANHTTLLDPIPTTSDGANLPRGGAAITWSRRHNDCYAKYSHVRRVQHTKIVNVEAKWERGNAIEWMCCGCRTYNFIGRRNCRRCKQKDVESFKHNFPPARHIPLFPTVWNCHLCGHANRCDHTNSDSRRKFYCGGCGESFGGLREWYCPSCNHVNSRGSTQCATCYEARPSVWTCSECKEDKNSVFYTECRNCRSSRQRLVSDSTVLCTTCHQRNDVQWEMCFVCMTPLGMMRSVKKLQEKSGGVMESAGVSSSGTAPTSSHSVTAEDVEGAKVKENDDGGTLKEMGQDPIPQEQQQQQQQEEEQDVKQVEESTENTNVVSTPQVKENTKMMDKQEVSGDGSWWCMECQVLHRRNVAFCDICLRPKKLADLKGKEIQSNISKPSTWTCTACSHCNEDISRIICEKCQKPREQGQKEDLQNSREEHALLQRSYNITSESMVGIVEALSSSSSCNTGHWRCPYCRNMINVMDTSCCGVPREVPFGYWLCPTCCSTNRDERGKCIGCSAAPPEKPWRCLCCRNKNDNDAFFCTRCGSAHPHYWMCEKCGERCLHACDRRCRSCGSVKSTLDLLSCQNCSADNHPSRKSCFRCRARLSTDTWNCKACGTHGNEKHLRRCGSCGEARTYNMDEVTWICDVCNTAVVSGGDVGVRTQCPRCNSDCTSRSVCVPSRWKCRRCGLTNMYNAATCVECESKRVLVGLQTYTSCPACFQLTSLTVEERCEHCRGDLAQVINMCGSQISLEALRTPLIVKGGTTLPIESAETQGGHTREDIFAMRNTAASTSASIADSAVAASSLIYDNISIQSPTIIGQIETKKTFVEGDNKNGNTVFVNDGCGTAVPRMELTSEVQGSCVPTNEQCGCSNEGFNMEHDEEWLKKELYLNRDDDDDIEDDEVENCSAEEWSGEIPSWMCWNCEITNLEEAGVCANCGLRRADE